MSLLLRSSVIAILLTVVVLTAEASTLDHNFEEGNRLYSEGDYNRAIVEYQKILAAGYHSAGIYYNLGNAFFRDGQLGLAIVNYIRARRLDPRNDDIRANLEYARQFTIDRIEVTEEAILLDHINSFFDSFSLSEITWLSLALYILTACAVLGGFVYKWFPVPTPAFVTLTVIFVAAAIITGVKVDRDVLTRNGVVLAQQTGVKNGPGNDFNTQFTAHAGLMFKIEREESGFFLVNFENRLKGWIEHSGVGEI
jgi:tetratricopeptide (TPR) repeat protein